MSDVKYLELLAKDFPNVGAVANEIINLNAIRRLPKGTEYFFSDLHGEHEAFIHMLRSASGNIRTKIDDIFESSITKEECERLATLIYYPEHTLSNVTLKGEELNEWKRVVIYRLVEVCKEVSKKYTRSKVRKKIPKEYAYVIDELLHSDYNDFDKKKYYSQFIHSITELGISDQFIVAICELIQKLCVDRLHIVGDIFDRGPRADLIIEELMKYKDVDIQYGNHDIAWIGAACGNLALCANILRAAINYNSFDLLEDGYGINLRALSSFAEKTYGDDPCEFFKPKVLDQNQTDMVDEELAAKMHKAIAIIMFKLEGQLIKKHPEYKMDDRALIAKVDYTNFTVEVEGKVYELRDKNFPTVNPKEPLKLSPEEEELVKTISCSIKNSTNLHNQIKFIYAHASTYKCVNSNLLFHGCVPMDEDGDFVPLNIDGKPYKGKALFDRIDEKINDAYFLKKNTKEKQDAVDFMWYLWCGALSPMFGKHRIATFENYFIGLPETRKEHMNPYYKLSYKDPEICNKIMAEFGLDPETSHIIAGHVPVKDKDGEDPIKAGGKMFVIDGGIAKAYQPKTGIAGYTLVYNSRHLGIAIHTPFKTDSKSLIFENTPTVKIAEASKKRILVADTDIGRNLQIQIDELSELLNAYRKGIIKEKF